MTQEQAAEPLNMSAENLGKIERGLVPYDQRLLEAASDLYGCEPFDLLMRDPTDVEGIYSIWQHAKQAERKQIIGVVKLIVGSKTGTEG